MRHESTSPVRRNARPILTASLAVVALGLTVSACGAANETQLTSDHGAGVSGTLNGAGSSAQQAAQEAWRASFQEANPSATVNYNPSGSGAGREQFLSGGSDFAGSDAALDPAAGEVAAAKKRCGADAIEVPDYVSPIAIVYNLPGVAHLRLDAKTLAGIFAGRITRWNDPAIAALNSGTLPSTAITPVHRSDSSGTTDNFTDYLHAASGGVWQAAPSGDWPLRSGEGASGTSGMVAAVKAGKGTIAYVDESQAGGLSVASIRVGKQYVAPSAAGAAKALSVSPLESGRPASDLAVQVDRTTTAPGAYPLMLTSYLIACPTYPAARADLVRSYLAHVVSSEGQRQAAQAAGSAPLPAKLQKKAAALIDSIASS
ncbi:phosphate ABC transporter substrate-binding protein PstS [Nocardioides terrisoli]|uniref:phosphate ABC transporter substrate-binding protein PstS n=1 Tax=Nocardioides terrisoli TaxID=3388267 RepID=UPI00287BB7E1|nr:phosphate ABC transporter substrate-binding protein PstS [Nocardioides marmorisolisilvae]